MTKGNGKKKTLSFSEKVEVSGHSFRIQPLTIGRFMEMQRLRHESGETTESAGNKMMIGVLADCVLDESGELLFSDEDEVMRIMPAGTGNKLFQHIWRISGFDPMEQAELGKGLGQALSSDSSTSSPSPSTAQ